MSAKVYVVMAEIHEYSDSRHWIVAAFSTQKAADSFVVDATVDAERLSDWRCSECDYGWSHHLREWHKCKVKGPTPKYDPEMASMVFGGSGVDEYEVHEVELDKWNTGTEGIE